MSWADVQVSHHDIWTVNVTLEKEDRDNPILHGTHYFAISAEIST